MADRLSGDLEVEAIAVLEALDNLEAVEGLDAAFEEPEAVVEPHAASLWRRIGEGRG